MFILKYIFFIPFVCPNPSHPSFMWDWSVLSDKWEFYIYLMFIANMVALAWFYFFTKPKPKSVQTFIILTIFLFILGGLIASYYLYVNRDILFIENASWTFEHTLVVFLSGLVTTAELYLISLLIFLTVSQIPSNWNLRAMRRYPFKFVP